MRPSMLLVVLAVAIGAAACDKKQVPPLLPQISQDGKDATKPEASKDAAQNSRDQAAPR